MFGTSDSYVRAVRQRTGADGFRRYTAADLAWAFGEARGLGGRRHVAGEVGAEAGISVWFEIGEVDDGGRRYGRRDEMRDVSYDKLMLPEEVERDDRDDDVRREFGRVDLVEEDFFLECHRSIVA